MDGALERGFLEADNDDWAVYADELLARGDPRGELIATEQRLELEFEPAARERDRPWSAVS